jgi:hypothetical protein
MEENGILAMLYTKVPPECQEKLPKFMRTPKTIRSNPLLLKLYRRASNESKKKWKSMRTIPILLELYRKAANETKKKWKTTQNKQTHNIWTKEQNPILTWTLGNSNRTTENQHRKPRTPKTDDTQKITTQTDTTQPGNTQTHNKQKKHNTEEQSEHSNRTSKCNPHNLRIYGPQITENEKGC